MNENEVKLPTEVDFLANQIGELNKIIASQNVQLVTLSIENQKLKEELANAAAKE